MVGRCDTPPWAGRWIGAANPPAAQGSAMVCWGWGLILFKDTFVVVLENTCKDKIVKIHETTMVIYGNLWSPENPWKIQHETAKVCNFPTQNIIQKHFWGFAAGFHRDFIVNRVRLAVPPCHLSFSYPEPLRPAEESQERGPQDIPQLLDVLICNYCV